jgi:serine aminopeptidase S33 family
MRRWVGVALGVASLAIASACAAAEQVSTIATRPGVTLSYLTVRDAAPSPKVVVVSFIGGVGAMNLAKRAESGPVKFGPSANFLVRIRNDVADADFADVIVDAPSDRLPAGMSDDFRLGSDHAADIRALTAELKKQFPGAKLFLAGTSRGSISAAVLAASMGDAVQGVVLTSTVTNTDKMGPALSHFDFDTVKVPVLLVHHRDDGCRTSPYSGAERLSKRYPLITVHGGDPSQTGPCEPLAPHGYFGKETAVAKAMKDWMLGRDYARDID